MSFSISPTLGCEQRSALEHMFFFNANQHRVLTGIRDSIALYGVPEIIEQRDGLQIRVGSLQNVQTLFAVSELGSPLGVAVFAHFPQDRFVILHLVVAPRLRSSGDPNTPVLLELMREIRATARNLQGIERLEMVYDARHSVPLHRSGMRC